MTSTLTPAPTGRQLRYLRGLAAKTGSTFASPATRTDASREIERMSRLATEPRDPSHIESGGDPHYATAVQADEVSGFGASATWRSSTPAIAAARHGGRAHV